MQIERLMNIIFILLNKKNITAKELSEKFEVSTRTIYRDIETLSFAGIPVYARKGRGGGISIVEEFTLNNSLFSKKEQDEIIFALQSFTATSFPDTENILNKITAAFNAKENINWIEVDFSYWGSSSFEKNKFNVLKKSILNKKVLSFEYINTHGEKIIRETEPIKLVFKAYAWYMYAFCRYRNEFRIFKISRMKCLTLKDETFIVKSSNLDVSEMMECLFTNKIIVKLLFSKSFSFRVYDEFPFEDIKKNNDGSLTMTTEFSSDDNITEYLLSFAEYVKVLEPPL